ncbi:MAG TPA: fibronectin type III domain-containing protein [Parafilimonas sp.]|nr:fibronectin type III domain-containing protein [Parafilimonas sp.]
MKTKILFLAILLLSFKSYTQTWQWTHPEPNGSGIEGDLPYKITSDNKGNIYELGEYSGNLYLDGALRTTGTGSFIAKYNAAGKLLWYKLINAVTAGGSIKAGDIAVLKNRLFLTGTYKPSVYNEYCGIVQQYVYSIGSYNFSPVSGAMGMFYTTLDLEGNVLSNLEANGIKKSSTCQPIGSIGSPPLLTVNNNNLYIAFSCRIYESASYFSLGPYPMYCGYVATLYGCPNIIVVKCDADGFILWSNFGSDVDGKTYDPFIRSITTDNNGSVFLSCGLKDNMQFGNLVFHTSSNNDYPNPVPYSTSVVVKISKAGQWKFIKEIANYTFETSGLRCQNLATDINNNLYIMANVVQNRAVIPGVILGETLPNIGGEPAIYLVKMDNNGNPLWKKYFAKNPYGDPSMGGGGYADEIIISNNRLYISGSIRGDASSSFLFGGLTVPATICGSTSAQYLQYFVAQADTDGNFKWATTICGGSNSEARSIYVKDGDIYTCGYYRVSINNLGHLNGSFVNSDGNSSNLFLGRLKDQYIRVGAISSKQAAPGCGIDIPFTATGLTFSAANHMIAELSNANGNFDSPVAIGDVKSAGSGVVKAVLPAALPLGTKGYRVRIRSTDTLLTGFNYYAYADTGYALTIACPAAPLGLTTTNIASTSATLNWTAVACAGGYKVQYRIKGTTGWTAINTNSNTSTLHITGLTANTIYQWRVATKCKNNGNNSFSDFSANKQFTTTASFAISDVDASAVSSANAVQAIVQPNPATTSATLLVSGAVKNAAITITDIRGKAVWRMNNVNSSRVILPVEKFAPGTYIIKFINGDKTNIVKLVKE